MNETVKYEFCEDPLSEIRALPDNTPLLVITPYNQEATEDLSMEEAHSLTARMEFFARAQNADPGFVRFYAFACETAGKYGIPEIIGYSDDILILQGDETSLEALAAEFRPKYSADIHTKRLLIEYLDSINDDQIFDQENDRKTGLH